MARYIDLENPMVYLGGYTPDGYSVYHVPSNTPTADVVERRHGNWVKTEESKFRPYMCSECGALFDVDIVMGELTWRFCPACGAQMKSE